jgi:ribonucleoside-diphosphate reductase alpha chain
MQSVQQDPQNLHPDSSNNNNKDRRCGVVGKAENNDAETSSSEKTNSKPPTSTLSGTPAGLSGTPSGYNNLKPLNLPTTPNLGNFNSNVVNSNFGSPNPNSTERMVNISVIDSAVAVAEESEMYSVSNRLSPHFSATTADEQYGLFQSDAPLCDACGAISVRSGNCYLCYNCGKSMGCS